MSGSGSTGSRGPRDTASVFQPSEAASARTPSLRIRPSFSQLKHPETILEYLVYPRVFVQPFTDPHE